MNDEWYVVDRGIGIGMVVVKGRHRVAEALKPLAHYPQTKQIVRELLEGPGLEIGAGDGHFLPGEDPTFFYFRRVLPPVGL